ncbi:HK97-gp10 family putative phage morphogenesis protein [Staphylococcus lugdunensis]
MTSNAGYSGFLEFGTRYMEAEPFMWPTYLEVQKNLVEDLKELLEG